MNKNSLFFVMILAGLMISCSSNSDKGSYLKDENIDMSIEMIMNDDSPLSDMPEYSKIRGGESEIIDRSFENAPPLIPHKVAGLLPINIDNNLCLRCHLPEKAEKFDATPMPKTHFTSYRPVVVEENGIYRVDAHENEVIETDLNHFNGAMFNCSQCHVPQTNVTVDISNVFTPQFRMSSGRNKSSLKNNMGEGIR
jgi:cytochrome c-type protein NapB